MKKSILLIGFCIICGSLYSQQSGESMNSEVVIGTTKYDLQTNKSCQNRMYRYTNGTIGTTWMMSQTTSFDDRGTGYNYYNGSGWGSFPASRIETIKSGWGSYAPYGANGEIVVSHQALFAPLNICKRTTRGSGSWVIGSIPLPAGIPGMLWARTVTNGPNHNYIHVIANTGPMSNGGTPYQGLDGAVVYNRSLDGGTTWGGWQVLPGMTSSQYRGFSADTYEWADPKGDTLCFVVGDSWNDLFIMKSCNNGSSWTKTLVWHCLYNLWSGGSNVAQFYCPDGSNAVALDNSGKAHVVFGRQRASGDYSGARYWVPFTDGLIYWNENQSQLVQTLDSAALAAGGHFIGYVQDPAVWLAGPSALAYYYTSLSSMPTMTIDQNNHIYVVWSGVTNHRDPNNFMLRHIFARASVCNGTEWCPVVELTGGTSYNSLECVYPGMSPTTSTDNLYFLYQSDNLGGSYIKGTTGAQGQTTITTNEIRCQTVSKSTLNCGSAPQVDFNAGNLNPIMNETVNLWDLSANCPASWQWSFSPSTVQYVNGSTPVSQNPEIQFTAIGAYSVTLTTSNIFGTGTLTKTNYITVSLPPPPVADFTATPSTLNIGGNVQFTDLSDNNPTSWFWTFEGGIPSTSTLHSPTPVRYDSAGQYTVSLTVTNTYGSDSVTKQNFITVVIPVLPSAEFSGTPTLLYSGEQVQFSDLTTGNPENWLWVFQGGTPSTSALQAPPAITYSTSGEYDVTLTAFNANGNSTRNKTKYITVINPGEPLPRFSGTPTTLEVGNQVQFVDESAGNPDTWEWTFEGGTPGSYVGQSPPPVTYNVAGLYDVSLEVTNPNGTHVSTIEEYVTVTNPFTPVADFSCNIRNINKGDSVLFTDVSTGYPSSWSWTFEGGTPGTSSEQSPPPIIYSNSGNYNVTLIVTNPNGSNTMSKNDYILVGENGIGAKQSEQLSAYPNPATENLFFKAEWIISEVMLRDLYGKVLIHKPINLKSGFLDISSLAPGLYILSATRDKNQVNLKIVIQ